MMRNRVDGGSKQCGGVREPGGSSPVNRYENQEHNFGLEHAINESGEQLNTCEQMILSHSGNVPRARNS